MFQAYIDDTGVQDRRACGLAELVGSAAQMARLARKWKEILFKFEVPSEIGFKANPFFHHEGIFKGWDTERWRGFLNKLLDSIYRSRITCISGMVDVEHFKSLNEDERRWLTGGYRGRQWDSEGSPSNPYFVAFYIAVNGAALYTPIGDKATLTFDAKANMRARLG